MSHMRIIGSLCFATNLVSRDKFGPRAIKSVLLGYAPTQKGYKLYDLANRIIFVSRDVIFNEKIFPFQQLRQESQSPSSQHVPAYIFPTFEELQECATTVPPSYDLFNSPTTTPITTISPSHLNTSISPAYILDSHLEIPADLPILVQSSPINHSSFSHEELPASS